MEQNKEQRVVKVLCTGRGSHKPAYLGRLSSGQDNNGAPTVRALGAFDSFNEHNGRGVTPEYRAFMPSVYTDDVPADLKPVAAQEPLAQLEPGVPLDGARTQFVEGVSATSFRYTCGRCSRDFRIKRTKLAQAVDVLIDSGVKDFDLSNLPFG